MGKRKAKLTVRKKRGGRWHTGLSDPTPTEWRTMHRLRAFIIPGVDKETGDSREIAFGVGSDAIVHSADDDRNVWVARIIQIRARESDNIPWVKVRWYYSGSDIANELHSFTPQYCAPLERTLSDKQTILGWGCFRDVTYVHEYHEDRLDPPDIGEDIFFQRHKFSTAQMSILPPVERNACKLCRQGYNPFPRSSTGSSAESVNDFDSDSGYTSSERALTDLAFPATSTMHFCPRPQCRQWYHRQCLQLNDWIEQDCKSTFYIGSRSIRYLAVDPDSKEPHPVFKPFTRFKPARATKAKDVFNRIQHLPPALVRVAQQPILRHPNAGVESIAGNVREVVLARRLIYAALEEDEEIIDDVTTLLNLVIPDAGLDGGEEIWAEIYDILDHARLLATPYVPYWEKRGKITRRSDSTDIPYCICPVCKGAI